MGKTDDVDYDTIKDNQDYFDKANDWKNVDDDVIPGVMIIPEDDVN